MIQYLVGGVVGALLLFLGSWAAYASLQLSGARQDREEALKIVKQAMDAKESAEEGFSKAKQFFEDRMKIPVVVGMSDEQIDILANKLGAKLFDVGRAPSAILN